MNNQQPRHKPMMCMVIHNQRNSSTIIALVEKENYIFCFWLLVCNHFYRFGCQCIWYHQIDWISRMFCWNCCFRSHLFVFYSLWTFSEIKAIYFVMTTFHFEVESLFSLVDRKLGPLTLWDSFEYKSLHDISIMLM